MSERPLGLSWWVEPGWLLAGAYPGHFDADIARAQLGKLLDAGIGCVVDLMEEEPRGARPYPALLDELARERGVRVERLHLPIEDHDVPGDDALFALEERLFARLERGLPCYFHCWGGRGRTGVLAGVLLIRLGRARPDDFVETIGRLRSGLRGRSPETDEQEAFVRRYVVERAPPPAAQRWLGSRA